MKLYSMAEVAEIFGVSYERVRQMMKAKQNPLVAYRENPYLFTQKDVRAFAQARVNRASKWIKALDKIQ